MISSEDKYGFIEAVRGLKKGDQIDYFNLVKMRGLSGKKREKTRASDILGKLAKDGYFSRYKSGQGNVFTYIRTAKKLKVRIGGKTSRARPPLKDVSADALATSLINKIYEVMSENKALQEEVRLKSLKIDDLEASLCNAQRDLHLVQGKLNGIKQQPILPALDFAGLGLELDQGGQT